MSAQDDVATIMLEDGGLCGQLVPPVVPYVITQCLVLGSMYGSDPVPAEGPILGYRADTKWIVLTKDRGPVAVIACFGHVVGSDWIQDNRPLVTMPCKKLSADFCANVRDADKAGVTGLETLLQDCGVGLPPPSP